MKNHRSRKKTNPRYPFSRSPSQELAGRLVQNWGIERTPAECKEMLSKAVALIRGMMIREQRYLPPWDLNAMRVIALMNSGKHVFTRPTGEGGVLLSAFPNGSDWRSEAGSL